MQKKFAENKVKRKINRRKKKSTPEDLSYVLKNASIPEFNILSDGSGIWVKIRKEKR